MDSMNKKTYFGIFSLMITIVILYTLSRSSWLAALAIVPFFIIFLESKQRMSAIFLTVIAVGILVLFAPSNVRRRISNTFVKERVTWQQQTILGQTVDQSTSMRLSDWKKGIDDWLKNHFIFGYGVTGYSFMDSQYIKIAVETGIVGLIAFIALIVSIFKYAWLSYKKVQSPFFKGLSIGYLAGLVGLLVHGIGTNTFIIVRIMEPFWFLTGIVIMLPELDKIQEDNVEQEVVALANTKK
jgi:O-antigen ligase